MAASFGISPMESAFEVMGLVHCKQIMDFLFVETQTGLAVALLGVILAFIQAFKKQNFGDLFSYVFMSLSLAFLFIKPVVNFGDTTSAMEKEGWTRTTTNDYLEEKKVSDGGSLGLVYISHGLNAIVQGTIKAITKATGNEEMSYLKNPFFVNKVSAYLKEFTANGIDRSNEKNSLLAYDVNKFLKNCYHETLTLVAQDSEPEKVSRQWWPGHKDIVARYCSKCKEDCAGWWIGINNRLDGYVKKGAEEAIGIDVGGVRVYAGIAGLLINFIRDKKNTEMLKRKLLRPEIEKTLIDLMKNVNSLSGGTKQFSLPDLPMRPVAGLLGWGATILGQATSTTAAMALIKILPHIQAYGLLISFSLFPFTLLICLGWRKLEPLVVFFTTLFWLKSWSIVWVIINYASIYMAELQSKLYAGSTSDWFIEKPYFNTVTSVLLIMSPAISWFFVKGVLSGIGEVASASTLHADKAIGKVKV